MSILDSAASYIPGMEGVIPSEGVGNYKPQSASMHRAATLGKSWYHDSSGPVFRHSWNTPWQVFRDMQGFKSIIGRS